MICQEQKSSQLFPSPSFHTFSSYLQMSKPVCARLIFFDSNVRVGCML